MATAAVLLAAAATATGAACARGASAGGEDESRPASARRESVRPGITVLLEDSIHLVRGKRIGLLTNQTGIDAQGTSDIDLLAGSPRAREADVRLVRLFAPEHGIRGTEDRENLESGIDERTGLVIHSLYGSGTQAPPDSTLRDLDAIVFDLQDIGTRTWTYVGAMIYAMRAAKRNGVTFIVLDRPNPITGSAMNGPMLDRAIANPEDPTPQRPGRAYALYPAPLRHGMTMGEMARWFNDELGIGVTLHVVPASGWRRALWFDETGLPWVKPSPNMPSLTSAILYPSLVAFEGSNLSVGRGTPEAFQRLGAPWLRNREAARLLEELEMSGVRFEAETFTPVDPGDRKYGGQAIPGIRIHVTDRDRVHAGRVGAALLWAIAKTNPDSLVIRDQTFDLRFGNAPAREALLRGDDPDTVIDREVGEVVAWREKVRKYFIYR